MKYKKGDVIKIREDLVVGKEYGGTKISNGFNDFSGKEVTITGVGIFGRFYNTLEIDDYYITDDMIEGLVKDKEDKNSGGVNVNAGHKIISSSDLLKRMDNQEKEIENLKQILIDNILELDSKINNLKSNIDLKIKANILNKNYEPDEPDVENWEPVKTENKFEDYITNDPAVALDLLTKMPNSQYKFISKNNYRVRNFLNK